MNEAYIKSMLQKWYLRPRILALYDLVYHRNAAGTLIRRNRRTPPRDLVKGMQYFVLRYTKYYHKMQAQEFVTDLFNDEKFQALFRVPQKHGEAMPLAGKVTKIDVEVVPSTATRYHASFFVAAAGTT